MLSLSPGATPVSAGEHVMNHANPWRITDDFWDRWELLYAMFERLDAWTPYRGSGHFPDADMLPIGKIDFGRPTNFTKAEQYTLMTLWAIGRSPLIFGGDMTQLDPFTREMLTNSEMLKVNQESTNNRQVSRDRDLIVWAADAVPGSIGGSSVSPDGGPDGAPGYSGDGPGCCDSVPGPGDKYMALFNAQSQGDAEAPSCGRIIGVDLRAIGIQGPARVTDLWNHKDLGVFEKEFSQEIPFHGAGLYRLSPVRP